MRGSMIGNFATSKAGHDKDKCYVIVREEGDFVFLSDGRLKTVANPKKKRRKHIQIINKTVSENILERLKMPEGQGTNPIRDEEIKYEIKQYMSRFIL
jgi:ribosomal protein L14E/L6E/L27E